MKLVGWGVRNGQGFSQIWTSKREATESARKYWDRGDSWCHVVALYSPVERGLDRVGIKPSAWIVKAPIGGVLRLCHSEDQAKQAAEKLTSESRIVPLYEYEEWAEIRKSCVAEAREEGMATLSAELDACFRRMHCLEAAIVKMAEQDCTVSSVDGRVTVDIDAAVLNEIQRVAIKNAIRDLKQQAERHRWRKEEQQERIALGQAEALGELIGIIERNRP